MSPNQHLKNRVAYLEKCLEEAKQETEKAKQDAIHYRKQAETILDYYTNWNPPQKHLKLSHSAIQSEPEPEPLDLVTAEDAIPW